MCAPSAGSADPFNRRPREGRYIRVKLGLFVRGASLIAAIVVAAAVVRATGLDGGLEDLKGWIDARVRSQGLSGELLFVAAGTLATAVGLSRQVLSMLAGYAFGVALGTGLALIATVGGCITAFAYARFLGRALIGRRYPARIRRVDDFLRLNPFLMTLAVRLLPVGNNTVTTLAAGVSSVPAVPFVAASALGYLPQTVVFALVGSGVEQSLTTNAAMAVALFVGSALIGVYLYRRHRQGRSFDDGVDDMVEDDDPRCLPVVRPGREP